MLEPLKMSEGISVQWFVVGSEDKIEKRYPSGPSMDARMSIQ
jgi:hypothetical protein